MSIYVVYIIGIEARILQRSLHGTHCPFAGWRRTCDMVGIAAHAETEDLAQYLGATRACEFVLIE